MFKRFEKNELLLRMMVVVFVSLLSVILATSIVVYQSSKAAYIKSYASSNRILLEKFKIENDRLSEEVSQMLDGLNTPVVENFLKSDRMAPTERAKTIHEFNKFIKPNAFLTENIISNLVLISLDGKTFYHNSNIRKASGTEILTSKLIKETLAKPNLITYTYLNSGLSQATDQVPGTMICRKLLNSDGDLYGFATIFIQENQYNKIYSTSVDGDIDQIFVINDKKIIQSTNGIRTLDQPLPKKYQTGSNEKYEILTIKTDQFGYTIVSVIDKARLVANMHLLQPLLVIVAVSLCFVGTGSYLIIRRSTKPIYDLIASIAKTSSGDFSHIAEVKGTHEVRELATAYNQMLEDLADYFEQVISLEREKNLSDIHALQMQIQPHFIYNTLATIKFLFYQGDSEQGIKAIDSFIQLLRYTLSYVDSSLTLSEEVDYLKHYATIMHLRFGHNIHTNFLLDSSIDNIRIPKMLIQPIIENAFLHAFPDQREGFINVFITPLPNENKIRIEVMDNGIGIDNREEQLSQGQKGISYTSIGLNNIRSRLKLLYGEEGVLEINSVVNQGTNIMMILPSKK